MSKIKIRGGYMIVKDGEGGSFETPEAGSCTGVCYRIIDIGTQTGEYEGKPVIHRQLIIMWEIEEKMKDGKQFSVAEFYTRSLNEKAKLRKHLEAWRGKAFTEEELKGFDIKNLLGKCCMLSMIKKENGKIKVSSVSSLPKGLPPIQPVNPLVIFDLDEYNETTFNDIPDGIKNLIRKSPEYQKVSMGVVADAGTAQDESVPF